MVSHLSWFVLCSTVSATLATKGRSERHALCGELEKLEVKHFPLAYTCLGDGADAICDLQKTQTLPDESLKEGDSRDEDTEPGAETWWVYQGHRQHGSVKPEGQTADGWINCANYIAIKTSAPASSEMVSDRLGRLDEVNRNQIKTFPEDSHTQGTHHPEKLRSLKEDDTDRNGKEDNTRTNIYQPRTSLVHAPSATCDDVWLSWPAMQERAIARGTVVVFDIITSVGNLFLTFDTLMKFVRLLDLGLILTWTGFPGFRKAFNPGEIDWNLDPNLFTQSIGDGSDVTGLHSFHFGNFAMVLSNSQLELLALTLALNETNTGALAEHFRETFPDRMNLFMGHVMRPILAKNKALNTQPCTWNRLLSRSPSMVASLEEHSPWAKANRSPASHHQATEYIAWHIRTTDGETARSYNPTVHKYVIQEPSSVVCPAYRKAMEDALQLTTACSSSLSIGADDELVYISSNSISMAKDCTVEAASHDIVMGHVDMGLDSSDAHTAHSANPLQTALGAFLDFFFLLDATVIVRTGSSFSGTVAKIKGMHCERKVYDALAERTMFLCLPPQC